MQLHLQQLPAYVLPATEKEHAAPPTLSPDFYLVLLLSSLFVSLSDLLTAPRRSTPYLLRLSRRPRLSFLAQPQEIFLSWANIRQKGQKAKGRWGGSWKWAKLLLATLVSVLNLLLWERPGRGGTLFCWEEKEKRNLKLASLVACLCPEHPLPTLLFVKWEHVKNMRLPAWEGGQYWTGWGRRKASCGFVVWFTPRSEPSVPGGGSRKRKGIWCQLPIWQKLCSSQHCKSQSSRWWKVAVPGPVRPPQPCAGSASRWGGWRRCRSRAWRPAGIRILLPPARNTCSSHPLKSPLPVMRTLPGPTAPHPVPPRGASASSFGSGCVWERRRNTVRAGMFFGRSPSPASKKSLFTIGR